MKRFVSGAALISLLSSPVSANEADWSQTLETVPVRLAQVGTWRFSAAKENADGQPECFEDWSFNADGSGAVVSGAQQLAINWTYKKFDDLGDFLFIKYLSSTDSPDCMGRAVDPSKYPQKASGMRLMFYNNGAEALVCTGGELRKFPDGTTARHMSMEHCWGRISAQLEE